MAWIYFGIIAFAILTVKFLMKVSIKKCVCPSSLVGKTVIITGGNSGIGYNTALHLAARGGKIIIADVQDSSEAVRNIIKLTGNINVSWKYLNLLSFKSIRQFAKEINESENKLDILINNAGVGYLALPKTEDGFNPVMQVNYIGPFLLTHLLLDLCKRSKESRIMFTSSILAYYCKLSESSLTDPILNNMPAKFEAYGNSKVLNIIAAKILAKKLKDFGIAVYSVNPGYTTTPMLQHTYNSSFFYIPKHIYTYAMVYWSQTVYEGIQTTLHLALSKHVAQHTGKFFSNCGVAFNPWIVRNEEMCNKLWHLTEHYAELKDAEKSQS